MTFKQEYKFINIFWQETTSFFITTFPATLKTQFTAIKKLNCKSREIGIIGIGIILLLLQIY